MNISKRMSIAAKGILTFLSCAFLMVACVEPEDPTTDPTEPTVPTEPKSDVDIIADALLDCVTKDMDAPDRLKSKVEELKKLESVKDVEVGESALQVTFKDGSVTVFPYMYPSPFDYDGFVENITTKASIGLDTKATNGKKAAVFNGYSAFKQFHIVHNAQVNALVSILKSHYGEQNVDYFEGPLFNDSSIEGVMTDPNYEIVFFSSSSDESGRYINIGVEKPEYSNSMFEMEFHGVASPESHRFYSADVKSFMDKAQSAGGLKGKLVYFANCNVMKQDFSNYDAAVVGWSGVNTIGQAYGMILIDALLHQNINLEDFLKSIADKKGNIADPLKGGKLKTNGKSFTCSTSDKYDYAKSLKITSPRNGESFIEYFTFIPRKIDLEFEFSDYSKYFGLFKKDADRFTPGDHSYSINYTDWTSHNYETSDLDVKSVHKDGYSLGRLTPGVWKIKVVRHPSGLITELGMRPHVNSYTNTDDCIYVVILKEWGDNDDDTIDFEPKVETVTAMYSKKFERMAVVGSITNTDGVGVRKGVKYWDSTKDEGTAQTVMADTDMGSMFYSLLTDVSPSTEYAARALCYSEKGKLIEAADTVHFVSNVQSDIPANPEYVDLGLSVKWATCNLGATKPEEYGLYYQWGDTQGYGSDTSDGKYFEWSDGNGNVTYKWCNGSYNSLTKYNTNSSYGTVENKTVLDMEDDAARAALGGNWRMPTDAEWTELKENCTWTWTKDYNGTGVAGMIVTSKKSGYTNKSIFLPAAGVRYGGSLYFAGLSGRCWSSSLYTDLPDGAWCVFFLSDSVLRINFDRYYGQSVRPVYTETEATPSISVTPTDLDFGTVKVGSSATASFTVTNTGSAVANVSISAPSAPVTSSVSGNITLNAGVSKTVTLTYSPKEKVSVGGSISVVSGGNTVTVRYSGNAEESTGSYSYEYVDLGLSVKWATCNLGATKPEEYGLYYQWGDTQGYSSDTSDGKYFDWSDGNGNVTYKWCYGSYYSLTKYNTGSSYGTVDNKTVLDMEDDAARAALSGNWRMPTDAEWTELRENCTWTWTSNYYDTGVAGSIVTSNKTGYTDKSIFLPAAGSRYRGSLYNAGSRGLYWSSSLNTDLPNGAWCVFFLSDSLLRINFDRYYGQSVRPVLE